MISRGRNAHIPVAHARSPSFRTKTVGEVVGASALSLSENKGHPPASWRREGRETQALEKARDLFHARGGDDVMTEEEVVKERKPGGN